MGQHKKYNIDCSKRSNPGHSRRPSPSPEQSDIDDIQDLIGCLRFASDEGRIWFDSDAVALVRPTTLSSLHREIISKLGLHAAEGFMTRMGCASGARDASLIRRLRPHASLEEALVQGPQMRSLRGLISMDPIRWELDLDKNHFYSEATFSGDFEADTLLANDGMASSPSCWMQVGYAMGYASTLLGRPAVYKETECCATGSRHCRLVGKLLEEWYEDEIEEILNFLPDDLLDNRTPQQRPLGQAASPPVSTASVQPLPGGMVGGSAALVATCQMLEKVAGTTASVLFLGETGVGKGVFARTLHEISQRADQPFVALNCAAIPENLIESELFGVEKGAYTGAHQQRQGRFERAHGGTLFLDEIGTLTMTTQVKLLRAIQEREIERVGGNTTLKVDVRIVAATNEDLKQAVKTGRFREDLLFRINTFPITIPPLRERRDDIPLLMMHFLNRYSERHDKAITSFTDLAASALYCYDYPGNIRELENLIERAVILAEPQRPIDLCHFFGVERLQAAIHARPGQSLTDEDESPSGDPLCGALLDGMLAQGKPIKTIERKLMAKALAKAEGNLSAAARLLGVTRPQLAYRLKKGQAEGD